MKISNNVQALKAYRNLTANQLSIKTTMDKLSSGQKINRAADDAAGLALSEKMRNRLQALDKAEQNVLDGISMVQTLEGGMTETHSLLQRMRELAVQASNGTLAPEDRSSLQSEIDQLTNEVTRIAKTTQFNGKDILDAFELALQLRQLRRQRPFCAARNLFRIDTDRIDFGLERFSPGHMLFTVARRQAGLHRYAIQKRQSVAFGLETQ